MAFVQIDLVPYLNNRGVTDEENYQTGFLSGGKSSLPKSEVPAELTCEGVPFVISLEEHGDNLEMEGQTIRFPEVTSVRLHLLGCSGNGDLFDRVEFLLGDETVGKARLALTDYLNPEPQFGETLALRCTHLWSRAGRRDHLHPSVWYTTIDIQGRVDGMRFEDNPFLHVFAMTFEVEEA